MSGSTAYIPRTDTHTHIHTFAQTDRHTRVYREEVEHMTHDTLHTLQTIPSQRVKGTWGIHVAGVGNAC